MPREQIRIPVGLWSEAQFAGLAGREQWLYLLLMSQPDITAIGVLPVTMRRWAKLAANTTEPDVATALAALETAGLVIIDHDTQELLVVDFMRHQGIAQQPNVLRAAVADARRIFSKSLRTTADELLVATGADPHAFIRALEENRATIPAAVRQAVYERDGHRCVECDSTENLTLDHIHPWSAGGSDAESNLRTLCRSCNSRKGARL